MAYKEVRTVTEQQEVDTVAGTDQAATRAVLVVNYLLGIVEILLGLRFLLRLFGANPSAGFTDFVYTITNPLMAPFNAVFRVTVEDQAVFDWSVLVAMLVYALIAWGIVRLIEISSGNPEGV
jgi:uncharacterized protein YggT (Ycf19 family)